MVNPNQTGGSGIGSRVLSDTRATFESLANSLPLSLLLKDAKGRRVFANRAYLKLRGTTLEDLVGKRDEDLFPPEIARGYREDDRKVMETGEPLHNIEQTRDAEGRLIWIERVKSPIIDINGNTIGLQLLFWDVTDRVEAERTLDRERHLLRTLLDNIPDSIYFKDTDSRFLRLSRAMAKKFGMDSVDDVIGRTDADIFTEQHARAAREDELHIIRTGEPLVDRVERETWPHREDSWCMSTKMPLRDDSGKIIGTFGISRDITELKNSQDALRAALQTAAEANRAKSDFLANMSHEIRTPMNAIIGMSELLSQTRLTHEQRDYVDLIGQSADALLSLLNDILDLSKIEARRLELECIAFSVRDTIGKTGQTLSVRAAEKGLELSCRVAPDVPDRLQGDPGRVRQILINLVGNAIKFTDEGEVVIDVSHAKAETGGTHWLTISVRDTGIGIPPEKQSAVLEAFTQADASTTRRFGGTGLGLTISRQLVELMGGSLKLKSQVGEGTTFWFTIPLTEAEVQEQDPSERLSDLAGMPVLVVDDNDTNRRILQEIFNTWRFDPHAVPDGPSAIEEFRRAAANDNAYPLVILDCMMPDMDGFEVAERIRESATGGQPRMIMLSSANRSGDAARCEEVGIARYMTKPVVQSELLDTVLHVMGVEREPPPDRSGRELPPCPPLRVLVAEDGLANQHVAVGLLKSGGHEAVVASDGDEAISRWSSEPFDLILMDMHMPGTDGLAATTTIRAREKETGRHIPIIALTAAAMPKDAEACRHAGMDDYLPKPIHPRTLQEMLAKHAPASPAERVLPSAETAPPDEPSAGVIGRQRGPRQNLPPDGDGGTGGQRPTQPPAGEGAAARSAVDFEAAASRVAGGLKGVRQLAEVFLEECQSLGDTLDRELAAGDAAAIRRAAHTLKGSANLFAASRVSQLALDVEKAAANDDLETVRQEMPRLRSEVERMLAELREFLDKPPSA